MKNEKNYYLSVTVPNFSEELAGAGFQRIEGKLLRVIEEAKREIVICGYVIKELPKDIENALKKKSHLVKMVTGDQKEQVEGFLKRLKIKDKAVGYFRNENQKKKKPIYHIKCMLIDYENILIGSANFTKYAMKKNIELSVLILDDRKAVKSIKLLHKTLVGQKELRPLSKNE